MVEGLDIFTAHFKDHTDHYILIGGSACDTHFDRLGLPFRQTKDLDIILVVEALSNEFIDHFWQFIKDGEYALAEKGKNKQFYRFIDPQAKGYPYMIELFARKPDLIKESGDIHLTDIPTDEEVSSLSAILLDDDYYHFTIANSFAEDGLRRANDIALIVLKAKAFLNNRERKNSEQKVHEDDIIKHRKDVIRLTAALDPGIKVNTPASIRKDLNAFIEILKKEDPEIKALLKNQGMGNITLAEIIEQLQLTFGLSS